MRDNLFRAFLILIGCNLVYFAGLPRWITLIAGLLLLYLTGRTTRLLLSARIRSPQKIENEVLIDFFLGLMIFTFITLFNSLLFTLTNTSVIISLDVVLLLLFLVSFKFDIMNHNLHEAFIPRKLEVSLRTKANLASTFTIVYGIFIALLVKSGSPGYLILDNDIFKELLSMDYIFSHKGMGPFLLLPTGDWYGVVDYRPMLFRIFMVGFSYLTNVDAFTLLSYSVLVTIPLFSFLILKLCYILTRSWQQSVAAAFFGASVCGGYGSGGPQIVLPASTALIISLFLILTTISLQDLEGKKSLPLIGVLISGLFLLFLWYFYIIPITFFALVTLLLAKKLEKRLPNSDVEEVAFSLDSFFRNPLWLVSLFFLLFTSFFFPLYQRGTTSLDLLSAINLFGEFYTFPLLFLLLVGFVISIAAGTFVQTALAFLNLTFILFFFLPLPGAFRIELLIRPFLVITMATIFNPQILKTLVHAKKKAPLKLKIFPFIFLVILLPVLIQPYYRFIVVHPQVQGINFNTEDEYEAAVWIKNNTPVNSLIISDIDTSLVIQSISGREGVWSLRDPALMYPGVEGRLQAVHNFFRSKNPAETLEQIISIFNADNRSLYIVMSVRTPYWILNDNVFHRIWNTELNSSVTFQGWEKFQYRKDLFNLVYVSNIYPQKSVKVYEVIRQSEIPRFNLLTSNNPELWRITNGQGMVRTDETIKVSTNFSIRATITQLSGSGTGQLTVNSSTYWDFSGVKCLGFYFRSNATEDLVVHIRITDMNGNWREYLVSYSASTEWQEFRLPLDFPDDQSTLVLDLSNIKMVDFFPQFQMIPVDFWIDGIWISK